jgi:rubrerythrin|tara:strand:- start:3142 stop:3324 length:183 start_codon:yes stop_codon:yes gene_type:complete
MSRIKQIKNTKIVKGYEFIEYLYECPECDYETWAGSKRLFQTCPVCLPKKDNPPKVQMAI